MTSTRSVLCVVGWALAATMSCAAPVYAQAAAAGPDATGPEKHPPVSQEQIDRALGRAKTFLLGNLPGMEPGRKSVSALALLKAGVSLDEPALAKAVDEIAGKVQGEPPKYFKGTHFVYEASVDLMALANADVVKYKPQIQAIADFLIENQGPQGDWDYESRTNGDTSITQYAILGLWEAARAGVPVPLEVWDRAAHWHVTRQNSDGGYTYHPAPTSNMAANALHSMTAAGLGSLHVCRRFLFPDAAELQPEFVDPPEGQARRRSKKFGVLAPVTEKLDPEAEGAEPAPAETVAARDRRYTVLTKRSVTDATLNKSVKWLTQRFTISRPSGWRIYYLYTLERASALANVTEYGAHDWYEEGASHLVNTQGITGEWADESGPHAGTAFAILFLSKATAKMLGRQPHSRTPSFGAGLLAGGRGLPEDLKAVQLQNGRVQQKKLEGTIDDLLAVLEDPKNQNVAAAQSAVVETLTLDDRSALIGQRDRLTKLAADPRSEVRKTALWALGRGRDLRAAPLLIQALSDPDDEVAGEARDALRILSRKLTEFAGSVDEPRPTAAEIAKWKAWYLSVRPYDERNDLEALAAPR